MTTLTRGNKFDLASSGQRPPIDIWSIATGGIWKTGQVAPIPTLDPCLPTLTVNLLFPVGDISVTLPDLDVTLMPQALEVTRNLPQLEVTLLFPIGEITGGCDHQ